MAAGDREAFASLYSRYGSALMGFLFRLSGDRALAEDLTQDVFLKVWRAAPGWRPLAKVSTWLYVIARRHWWNEAARRRRRLPGPGSACAPERSGADPPPAERLARAEAARTVRAALATLTPRLRLVFVLLRLEGCSLAETASIAGIPVGTVKSRAAAAETALRKRLRGHPR